VNTLWKNVTIGGGGFVTGLIFSPTERGLVYARTDVGALTARTLEVTFGFRCWISWVNPTGICRVSKAWLPIRWNRTESC